MILKYCFLFNVQYHNLPEKRNVFGDDPKFPQNLNLLGPIFRALLSVQTTTNHKNEISRNTKPRFRQRKRICGRGPKFYNCVNVSVTWTQDVLRWIRGRSHKVPTMKTCPWWKRGLSVSLNPWCAPAITWPKSQSSTASTTWPWSSRCPRRKLREIVAHITSQSEYISTKMVLEMLYFGKKS